jgi:hypothetical protein
MNAMSGGAGTINPQRAYMGYASSGVDGQQTEGCRSEARQMGDSAAQRQRMDFGDALGHLKRGGRLTRIGWNGRSQHVFLVYGFDPSRAHERSRLFNGIRSDLYAEGPEPGSNSRVHPHFRIALVDGSVATWVPSITDLLAEDWVGL